MAATSDERREVARKLRGIASSYQPLYGTREHQASVRSVIGGVEAIRKDEAFLKSLIDLIDPTCEVDGVTATDCDTYVFALSCGHEVEWPWREGFAYCPECGARITHQRGSRRI